MDTKSRGLDRSDRLESVFTSCCFESFITKFTSLLEGKFIYTPPGDIDVDTMFTYWKYNLVLTLQQIAKHPDEYMSSGTKENRELKETLPGHINTLQGEWKLHISEVLDALGTIDGLRLAGGGKKPPLTPADINAALPEQRLFPMYHVGLLHERESQGCFP